MQTNHSTPKKMVIRSRLRSTTEDEPKVEKRPAEHVGQAAALALVQEHEQDQHQAGDDQDDGEGDVHPRYSLS